MPFDPADYHRIALITRIEDIDDVIAWADEEISRRAVPESELIDISLGKNRSVGEIDQLLRTLVVDLNDESSLKCVLANMSTMVREGQLGADEAIDRIYRYARSGSPTARLRHAFSSLAEDLSCIRDGVYWTDEVAALGEPLLDSINSFCDAECDENG